MSPKKSPDISQADVEQEIASLAGETSKTNQTIDLQDLKILFSEYFKKQDNKNDQLVKNLFESSQTSHRNLLSALSQATPP